MLLQGFSSGLPLLLTGGTLAAWMKGSNVDLTVIGVFALVGLPYTLKFAWAPFLDRLVLPFGRRRGWILLSQLGLALSLVIMSTIDPASSPWAMASAAFLTAFLSATQDVVIDAYRREYLPVEEFGLGASMTITGYRLGMLVAGGFALFLADQIPWPSVYLVMAGFMAVGFVTTLFCPEPKVQAAPPRSWKESIFDPFVDYFSRSDALVILVFILLYKAGDAMASVLLNPFYLDMGFTNTQIGLITKPVAIWATILGGIVGGILMVKVRLKTALLQFGLLQAVSTLSFILLPYFGASLWLLGFVIFFETFSGGMGTAAYAAFMMRLTNQKFTATQYALLSSLMGVPRVILGATTGFIADAVGWTNFFIICTVIAIPGLLLIAFRFNHWLDEKTSTP